MKKILFICTGNTCRSQIAEGFANNLGWVSFSAGTNPEFNVNPHAIKVMAEIGIDISNQYPKLIDDINLDELDIIMTVCSNAEKNCPIILEFNGKKLHHSFIDPANAFGTKDEILDVFREVRDEIRVYLKNILFYILSMIVFEY